MKKLLFISLILIGCVKLEEVKPEVHTYKAHDISTPFGKLMQKWDSLGVPAPAADTLAIKQVFDDLISSGQWDHLENFGIQSLWNKSAALVDWRNTNKVATIISDYAGSFITYKGFDGNGTSMKINSHINYGDGGSHICTQNSFTKGIYINSNETGSTKPELSCESSSNAGICTLIQGSAIPKTVIQATNNASDLNYVPIVQLYGWQISKRENATEYWTLKNGQSISRTPRASASIAIPNQDIYFLCKNVNGTLSGCSPRTISAYFFGDGQLDEKVVVNILNKFMLHVNSIPTKMVMVDGNSLTKQGTWVDRSWRNWAATNQVTDFVQAEVGRTTSEMTADFPSTLGKIDVTSYTKQVLFVWELTNSMVANSNNQYTTYNDLVTYLQQARATFPSTKIIVATCLPRGGSTPITPANRQNPTNLNDTTTLNGMIRVKLVRDGYADLISDIASDATIGVDSYGVAGVGERNTVYYGADRTHLTITGYNYASDNYFYASINSQL